METIVSLIPNDEHVTAAKQELETAGFAEDKINVLLQPVEVWQRLRGHQGIRAVAKKAALGAFLGLFVGAIYGVPAGIFNCKFMNCSLQTSVILWALITLFWVLAGGFLGGIIGLDKLEHSLYSYVEGVRRGEALFVVETPEERAPEARRILRQEQGTVIHEIRQRTVGQ
jgi:hypothetical protein